MRDRKNVDWIYSSSGIKRCETLNEDCVLMDRRDQNKEEMECRRQMKITNWNSSKNITCMQQHKWELQIEVPIDDKSSNF